MKGPKLWSAPGFAGAFFTVYGFGYRPAFATAGREVLGHGFAVYMSLLSYFLSSESHITSLAPSIIHEGGHRRSSLR